MKTYTDLWDYFFGTWGEIQIPMGDGTVKRVAATEKWIKMMSESNTFQQSTPLVITVHILDLATDMIRAADALFADPFFGDVDTDQILAAMAANRPRPTVEQWEIGKQISLEEYQKVRDPSTGHLYVVFQNVNLKKVPKFGTRESWEMAVRAYQFGGV